MNIKKQSLLLILCVYWGAVQTQTPIAKTLVANTQSQCPGGLKQVNALKLCVTNDFKQPAFHALETEQQCNAGYVRVFGQPFCIIDSQHAQLTMHGYYFVLTKSVQNSCGKGFQRDPKTKICVDERLTLSKRNGELIVSSLERLKCVAPVQGDGYRCEPACQPGYLQPLGFVNCVAFDLARRGHKNLENPDKNCSGSKYWQTHSANGLCVPKFVLASELSKRGNSLDLTARVNNGRCELPQVVNVASINALNTLVLAPVVVCSLPEIFRH